MLLNADQIRGLITDPIQVHFRPSSYDLSVGQIIPASNKEQATAGRDALPDIAHFILPPQGMVRIVSRERLTLPANVAGYALVKNRLCSVGVLAINIGLVDPGYEGPISSTLINFGKTEFVVSRDTPFLRVSFHSVEPCSVPPVSEKYSREEYLRKTLIEVVTHSSKKFLNLEETAALAAREAFGMYKVWLIAFATLIAAALALITIFVPLGASYTDRYVTNQEKANDSLASLRASHSKELQELKREVEDLRKAIDALQPRRVTEINQQSERRTKK